MYVVSFCLLPVSQSKKLTVTIELDPLSESKPPMPKRLSWWRTLYDRLSQSGQEIDTVERESFIPRRLSKRFSRRSRSHLQRTDLNLDDDLPPISLLLPPPKASPQRKSTSLFHDRPNPVSGQGQRHSRGQDLACRPISFVGDYLPLSSSEDGMIDLSHPRVKFDGNCDNNTRTGNTEHTASFNPIYQYHHHAQPNLDHNGNSNVDNHDQPHHNPSHLGDEERGHAQPQVQAGVPRSSSSTLPPVPRGALVFPAFPAPLSHPTPKNETEFDPWQEHEELPHRVAYPTSEAAVLNYQRHHKSDHHDPPPPTVPPKDTKLEHFHLRKPYR